MSFFSNIGNQVGNVGKNILTDLPTDVIAPELNLLPGGTKIGNSLDNLKRGVINGKPPPNAAPGVNAEGRNPMEQVGYDTVAQGFKSFGYDASPTEISALANVFHSVGSTGNTLATQQAVATYVQTVENFQKLNANDPTKQVMSDERGFFANQTQQAQNLSSQSQDLLKQQRDVAGQAPKLFGNLTPQQISAYLAPLKNQADQGNASLQTAASRRGLAGSSTELNSLADANRQYQENVLAQGLNVGLTEQQQLENILGTQGQSLLAGSTNASSLAAGSLGRQAGLAGAQQDNLTSQTNYLNQLPLYLSAVNTPGATAPALPSVDPLKGALSGGLSGAASGALIGSVVPGIGTGIGALAGGALGAVSGYL